MESQRAGEPAGVALVTGGSDGLGRAVALGLGAAGFAVAVLARSAKMLEETRALLTGSWGDES